MIDRSSLWGVVVDGRGNHEFFGCSENRTGARSLLNFENLIYPFHFINCVNTQGAEASKRSHEPMDTKHVSREAGGVPEDGCSGSLWLEEAMAQRTQPWTEVGSSPDEGDVFPRHLLQVADG